MKLLGLPDQNQATESWMAALIQGIGEEGSVVSVAHYRHWDDETEPDVAYEASQIGDRGVDLLIAKSLGTLISLEAHFSYRVTPGKAVFVGTPLQVYSDEQLHGLRTYASILPVLFIQQTADFTGSYIDLASVVAGCPSSTVAEVPGNDHMYGNVEELISIVTNWT